MNEMIVMINCLNRYLFIGLYHRKFGCKIICIKFLLDIIL